MKNDLPSQTEAEDALNAVHNIQQNLLIEYSPPVWLRLIMSLSYGAIFFGYGMTEHENNWALAMIVGAIIFTLSTALYYYLYKIQGIKIRIIPRSIKAEKINAYAAIGFAALGFFSRFLRTDISLDWAPHICAATASIVMFWLLIMLPTGETVVEEK
ncbi:hypothetical protein [Pseudoalteromonas luteoviolacea]|uniref:Uncharacterized protein n=1 Tax=Pseudoalteromonas luteoviolacea DSM 6061 TaxID=1365250 RepID=A0A167D9G0_9GAMM|nr:hypothetical protein [Pseudoalteromonas luteoviolacea]KZN48572.1 hypothetical protein N475_05970 [Pseudoalteromonas luteoviolacea DSM 6061]MBE0388725.1 hypothetical protein [Pseudoalteromonas luteoviolacea DSM 6061]